MGLKQSLQLFVFKKIQWPSSKLSQAEYQITHCEVAGLL